MAGFASAQPSPAGKCSPNVLLRAPGPGPGEFHLVVSDADAFQSWAEAEKMNVIAVYRPANIIVLRADTQDFLEKILPRPDVLFIDRPETAPREELPVPGHNLFVNRIYPVLENFPLLNGSGITVSIKENRFDTSDVDFRGRAVNAADASQEITAHANIIATLIGGAGNSDPQGRGVARGANLLSNGFNNLLPDDADYTARHITVQNHSYGVDIENYYGAGALAYDRSVMDHADLVQVFSAGNDGASASQSGVYKNLPGFANLTGNFKMAKNVLTVGMADSFGLVAPFSSRGPAYDGRIKPDLTAFGTSGTSESAALASGAAALVQQALAEQTGVFPAAATVRAVLLNSADDVPPAGPDYRSGFGSLNLKNALQIIADQHVITDAAAQGSTRIFGLDLPPDSRLLKVMLAWDDPPATPNAAKALVNDLDLKIVDPGGAAILPWAPNPFPSADSVTAPAVRRRDTLNNVEQVALDAPLPGHYEIRVTGSKVATAAQRFSLVYTWDRAGRFQWLFPGKGAAAVAARDAVVSWESTFADTAGRLEYRLAGAQDWSPVDSTVDLRKGWFRWPAPDIFAEAQMRMCIGGQCFESDTFLISRPLRMRIGFNCPDSVFLYWNAAGPDASYLLSGLGARYLEPLALLSDTFVILQKAQFQQQRFGVTPVGQGGVAGPGSPAPDINNQGVECYFAVFLAELNTGLQTRLRLSVGTRYGVRELAFEKMENGQFATLNTWNPVDTDYFEYTDVFTAKGINRYRARIGLDNGAELYSDTLDVYVLESGAVLVFPNPAAPNEWLHIVSGLGPASVFALYDVCGNILLEQTLAGDLTEVLLPGLPYGVYFWRITDAGKGVRKGGKIAIGADR